jgi:hypothetical protein
VSAPIPYPLWARAGDSFTRTLTWTEDDGITPVDLTDASVEFSLASRFADPIVYQFEDTDEASVTSEAGGVITLALSPEQTRELFGRVWRYEVTVTLADESRITLLDGTLTVSAEVVGVIPEEVEE